MIGANPFVESDGVRPIAYQLSSILYSTGILLYKSASLREFYTVPNVEGKEIPIMNCNFNPFIYVDGVKQYYQRDFVWTKRDCQNLIESIYQGVDCGKVVLRQRSFAENRRMALSGETELSFKDVVDGKQRLTAIAKFINNEYPDLHGNYFGDLSPEAKHDFYDHQLISFAEMGENSTDEAVLRQFLKMNHLGVPQSKEHIDFVKSLYGKAL